jgi:uncharacterized repeat protein (TIGR01451 family)
MLTRSLAIILCLLAGEHLLCNRGASADLQERDILMTLGMMEHASMRGMSYAEVHSDLPDGWQLFEGGHFTYQVGLDSTVRTQGKSSLKFTCSSAPPRSVWHIGCVIMIGRNGLKAGDRLRLRGQVRTGTMDNATLRVNLVATRPDHTIAAIVRHQITASNTEWQWIELTMESVPEEANRVSVGFALNIGATAGSATFWVDNVTLTNGEMLEVPVRVRRNVRTFAVFSLYPDVYEMARRYDVIVLHPLNWLQARPLKHYNPNVQVYVYFDSLSASTAHPDWADPLDYSYVMRMHPEWFLRDSQGNLVTLPGYPRSYLVDVGNADLQRRWLSRTVDRAQRFGFDGIYIDNIVHNIISGSGIKPVQYNSDSELQAAMTRFLDAVVPGIRQANLKVMANFGYVWNTAPIYQEWMRYFDGVLAENWVRVLSQGKTFFMYPPGQLDHINALDIPQPVMCVVQGRATSSEEKERRYLLACALLNVNQYTCFGTAPPGYPSPPDYLPDCELALGQPVERYTLLEGEHDGSGRFLGGVFRRRFTNGLVLVNMHPSRSFTVPIDSDYVDVYGRAYRQGNVELASQTALILVRPHQGVRISVVSHPSHPKPGDIVQHTVQVENPSAGDVEQVVVRVPVPLAMEFVMGSASDGGIYDATARTVIWYLWRLSPSQRVTRTFATRVR